MSELSQAAVAVKKNPTMKDLIEAQGKAIERQRGGQPVQQVGRRGCEPIQHGRQRRASKPIRTPALCLQRQAKRDVAQLQHAASHNA